MFKKTVKGDVKFPSHFSEECTDLVSRLLQLDPASRLGMQRRGVLDIKQLSLIHISEPTRPY